MADVDFHETQVTDAAVGPGDQAGAERALGESPGEGESGPARLDLSRGSALQGDAEVVETAWSGETGIESGVEDGVAPSEAAARVVEGEALDEVLRRDADELHEASVKMPRAPSGDLREPFQGATEV